MDQIHKKQMAKLSELGRNQFFLHAAGKIRKLESLVKSQILFGNTYNKRAVEFTCGKDAMDCARAYRNWSGALLRNFDQMVKNAAYN